MSDRPAPPKQTPSQTVGPFFALGLTPREYGHEYSSVVTPSTIAPGTEGERIHLVGRVLDGDGASIGDAMVEIWQANAHGRYRHPADDNDERPLDPTFHGFARAGTGTDAEQSFVIHTIKPGPVADDQAPHLNLILFMRGGLNHLYTRVYFDDEASANAADPVLSSVPEVRRDTLLARREPTPDGVVYRFDIHMQGARETVFFDL